MNWPIPNIRHFKTPMKKSIQNQRKWHFPRNFWRIYLTNGTHFKVTDKTIATIPKPQHKACISFGFFSHVQVAKWQFGSTTSTLTMLERKSLDEPAAPTAMASHIDKSGTLPRICNDKEIVSKTWDNFDNLIPLSTLTLKNYVNSNFWINYFNLMLTFCCWHPSLKVDWCNANLPQHLQEWLVPDSFHPQLWLAPDFLWLDAKSGEQSSTLKLSLSLWIIMQRLTWITSS